MKRVSLILTLVFLGGLLAASQVFAAGRASNREAQMSGAPVGEQLRQYHQVQTQAQERTREQVLTHQQVREMRALLNHRGYFVSDYERDGIGRETMAAIENFQRDRGLAVTGLPNEETLRALALTTQQHEFFGIAPEFGGDEE